MNETGRGQERKSRCITDKEQEGIIDKIEAAILVSLANKVLEQAAIKEEKIEDDRERVKLVELRRFSSRKKHVNPPSRTAC